MGSLQEKKFRSFVTLVIVPLDVGCDVDTIVLIIKMSLVADAISCHYMSLVNR